MTTSTAGAGAAPGVGLQVVFAAVVAIAVQNLYATQALVPVIAQDFGLPGAATGWVSAAALLGYGFGVIALAPLADIVENRRLALTALGLNVAALLGCAAAPGFAALVAAAGLAGATSSAIQVLVPLIASIAPAERRGRVVGNVMSGLMLGILLSRPLASLVAGTIGWRGFYLLASAASATGFALLAAMSPTRRPPSTVGWRELMGSLAALLRDEPVLRRAALRQGALMAAFNLFWTAVALRLAAPPFELDAGGIALFCLAGAAGVSAAPIAGRLGDRGLEPAAVRAACFGVVVAGLAAAGAWFIRDGAVALAVLAVSAVLLDFCVIADQTLGRRAINLIRPESMGRLNGLFTGLFFFGGAIGATLSGAAYALGGLPLVCLLAAAFGAAAASV